MSKFTINDVPNLVGKTILITGGNSGIGFETARILAEKGADVIIACRDLQKGEATMKKIKDIHPEADVSALVLDLTSLASIQAFIDSWNHPKLDILINNAGVMNLPKRALTEDGFEMHMGVNHLGHFALTKGLLPYLKKSSDPRVVTMSALVAYQNIFDFKNLQSEKEYRPMATYAQSKLANILFANELGKRHPDIVSVAVQPGSAMTNLQRHMTKGRGITNFLMKIAGQPVEDCALPTLYAATQNDVQNFRFYGPTGRLNKGSAGIRPMPKLAQDEGLAEVFWDLSERLVNETLKG